jgi:hypothetical protein
METKPLETAPLKVTGKLEEAQKEKDRVAEKHAAHFDKITKKIQGLVKKYDKKAKKDPILGKFWPHLSEAEKMFHVGGHLVGKYFEENLDPETRKQHESFMNEWIGSSAGSEIQGAFESMGVVGGPSPGDLQRDKERQKERKRMKMLPRPGLAQLRKKGGKDKKLQEYIGKAYAFQQAYFKHIGLTEVTMFRGVGGQIDGTPPADGDEVTLKTREVSSYSTDPRVAYGFGRVVQYKVPVDRVWGSSAIRPQLGSDGMGPQAGSSTFQEAELIIMGSSDLVGKVLPSAKEL